MSNLTSILKQATLYTDHQIYRIIKLHPRAITVSAAILAEIGEPFSALLVDKDEVTLVIESENYAEYQTRLRDHIVSEQEYALITLDIELTPDIVGLTATLSRALAESQIPIIPLGSYSRDHFLVPSQHLDKALATLKKLQD